MHSAARPFLALLHEMQRRNAKKGLAALCIGGGMGVSLAVER
jgi:acetyl-CoA C-acetyltransferase